MSHLASHSGLNARMVPLWDLFNHDHVRRTTLVTVSYGGVRVQRAAVTTVKEEESVSICYGSGPSQQLVQYSGILQRDGMIYD